MITATQVAAQQVITQKEQQAIANRAATEQAIDREGQITDRFSVAVEPLGSDKLRVRLGGIYAPERIAADSRTDVVAVLEILTAFVRDRAPWPAPPGTATPNTGAAKSVHPEGDVQAVLTVLERGRWAAEGTATPGSAVTAPIGAFGLRCLDLGATDLRGAVFRGTSLVPVCLAGANLTDADLRCIQVNQLHDVECAVLGRVW